jgi:hypothetical protein
MTGMLVPKLCSLEERGTSLLATVVTQPYPTSAVSCGESAQVCALCDELHMLVLCFLH